jgi:hypothetical protein
MTDRHFDLQNGALFDKSSQYNSSPLGRRRNHVSVERVSVASDGDEANGISVYPDISDNGRYVTYRSDASDLVTNDTNNYSDVFLYDQKTGYTSRVSVSSDGSEGNSFSGDPAISGDGNYIVYQSMSSNLVSGDTNDQADIFVFDQRTRITERVSVASDGSESNRNSFSPDISDDGRYITYESRASNLVLGDTNNNYDVFVYDRKTDITERISVASDGSEGNGGSQAPTISGNGRYVTYNSYASNLVPGDTNNSLDVFVYDRKTGITERVSVDGDGSEGNGASLAPDISDDGRYVSYHSFASNLVLGDTNNNSDVFVYDRKTGITERISVASDGSQGNGLSDFPTISDDGRYVAYQSEATNLVQGDLNNTMDAFVYDRKTGSTERVSVASDGSEGNNFNFGEFPVISGNGKHIAYHSISSNIVPGDTNENFDVFLVTTQDLFT